MNNRFLAEKYIQQNKDWDMTAMVPVSVSAVKHELALNMLTALAADAVAWQVGSDTRPPRR